MVEVKFSCAGVRFDFNHSSLSAEDVDIFFLEIVQYSNLLVVIL